MSVFSYSSNENQSNQKDRSNDVKKTLEDRPASENAVIPNKNDVLFGRGERINSHDGNQLFRNLVSRRKERYNRSKNMEKTKIAREIMEIIASKGGKFLIKESDVWVQVDPVRAMKKTSQALREKQTNSVYPLHDKINSTVLITPKVTTARPKIPAFLSQQHLKLKRQRTPEIFADAEDGDEGVCWREYYRRPTSPSGALIFPNVTNSRIYSYKLDESRKKLELNRNPNQIKVMKTEFLKGDKFGSQGHPKKRMKYSLSPRKMSNPFDGKSFRKEVRNSLETIPTPVLTQCFSYLPISSQSALLSVSPKFLKVFQSNDSLRLPLKTYHQKQLKLLEI